jgi:hypothetical protein
MLNNSSKLRITTRLKFLHSNRMGALELLSIKNKDLDFNTNNKKLSFLKNEMKKTSYVYIVT